MIGVVLFLMVLACGYGLELDHHEDHVEMMLDPFDRVKDLLKIHSKGLTLAAVNSLVQKLFSRIHCTPPTSVPAAGGGNPCTQSLVSLFLIYLHLIKHTVKSKKKYACCQQKKIVSVGKCERFNN